MKLEYLIQSLFGVVIVGILGFLGSNLFDMKGTLSSVSVKVDTTDQRLTRIADTLPEIKARIAWEEINNPLTGFVASTIPTETGKDKWTTLVKLYDSHSGKLLTYSLTQNKNQKDFLAYAVAGKVKDANAYAPSFAEMELYSNKEKIPTSIPANINAHTSFVLRNDDISSFSAYLKEVTGQEPKIKDLGVLRNWEDVSVKLEEIK